MERAVLKKLFHIKLIKSSAGLNLSFSRLCLKLQNKKEKWFSFISFHFLLCSCPRKERLSGPRTERLKPARSFIGLERFWGQPQGLYFPSPQATMLVLLPDSTAPLPTPQKMLYFSDIWEMAFPSGHQSALKYLNSFGRQREWCPKKS